MKIFKYLKDVVFFNPSMKAFDKLETERERRAYNIRVLKQSILYSNASIVISAIAICITILAIAIRIMR